MDKCSVITLEAPRYVTGSLSQRIPGDPVTRDIFCDVKSVKRAEWAAAAQNGRKAQFCVSVWADEYAGEPVAILDGVRYSIYRTYQTDSETIELYLEQKAGI